MSYSNDAEKKLLDHEFKNTAWPQPTDVKIGLHLASELTDDAADGQDVIEMEHQPPVGARISIGMKLGTQEEHVVASVTGSGPYTVTLEEDLANAHTTGEVVGYDPGETTATHHEVSGGSYVRKTHNSWNAAATNGDGHGEITNNGDMSFAVASADWGRVTHYMKYNDTAFTRWGRIETAGGDPTYKEIENGDQFIFPSGNCKFTVE